MENSFIFKRDKLPGNLILNSLLPAEWEWLQSRLALVDLCSRKILQPLRAQITAVYFPTTCLLSWTNSTELGETVEVGITGKEGMMGVPLLLGEEISPWNIEVQLPGQAFKLSTGDFLEALNRSAELRQATASFTYLKLVQLNQSALCNRFHSLEERLCRWLLEVQARTQTSEIWLTRDILAEMIGAGRPAVSLTTGTLQSAGLIRASRGKITLLNHEGMEDAACECYWVVKAALDHYLVKLAELNRDLG